MKRTASSFQARRHGQSTVGATLWTTRVCRSQQPRMPLTSRCAVVKQMQRAVLRHPNGESLAPLSTLLHPSAEYEKLGATCGRPMSWLVYHLAHHELAFKTQGYSLSGLGSHLAEKQGQIDLPSRKAIARSRAQAAWHVPCRAGDAQLCPYWSCGVLKVDDDLACLD